MEKNNVNFRITLDEGLKVIGVRQSKIDAIKQSTNESLLEIILGKLVLIISELEWRINTDFRESSAGLYTYPGVELEGFL